jgi:general secretion pathway protein A
MYTDYWRLKEKPFEDSLDMRYAYMTPQHKEGLARLLYTAEERKPGAILTGACGTGKSLLRSSFLARLQKVGNFVVASVDNPLAGIEVILTDIYDQIVEKPSAFSSFGAALRDIQAALLLRRARGFHSLILVEDAHLLEDHQTVEQLRLLLNLRDGTGARLVSLMFFGELNMLKTLAASPSLMQCIPNRWTMNPLTVEQTREYITYRLSVAGGNAWIIDDDAVVAMHRHAGGIPRLINSIADLALYLGMSESAVRIDAKIVDRIVKDWELVRPV